VLDAEKVRPAFRIGDMLMDAESYRPLFEFAIRVVNDFRFTNMFFVRKCSLLIRENPRAPAIEGIYRQSPWQPSASSHIGSIMSFEAEEEVHCRGREPVSAYPLICLRQSYDNLWKNPFAHANVLKTLPELSKFVEPSCDSLCDSLFGLLRLSQLLALWLPFFSLLRGEVQVILQLEIYNLTSSERVKRGVKRAWLIGETLARKSGQKRPNIDRTEYKGVRFRPNRSHTKPWTAEVKPPMEKNKVWIADCNTPKEAAHAYDVAAFYYGKGNKALNFEHTPRFLPKILEYSCEEGRKRAIQEQVRHLRRNPLFYLIHQLPYQVLFFLVLCEFQDFAFSERVELAWLVVQLMRLVRKDGVATIFRLLDGDVLMNVHVPTNIPQLLERIDCIIKEILPQVLWHHKLRSPLMPLFNWFTSCLPQLKAQDPTKDILLTLHFIEWVRINLVTPQKSSTKAEDLLPIPTQCSTSSMISMEIDLRAPQTSSMAMEVEDPLVNIPPQCNTSSRHYPPHEQIQDTLEQDLIVSHKFSLESHHLTYQDATLEEQQVVQSSIVEQAATIVLSTPIATIVETSLLCSPPFDVEIANEGFQTWDFCENIQVEVNLTSIQVCASRIEPPNPSLHCLSLVGAFQEGSMSRHMISTLGTSSNFHPPPFNCKLEHHTCNSLAR
jgi:hypothetical protein